MSAFWLGSFVPRFERASDKRPFCNQFLWQHCPFALPARGTDGGTLVAFTPFLAFARGGSRSVGVGGASMRYLGFEGAKMIKSWSADLALYIMRSILIYCFHLAVLPHKSMSHP